MGNDNDSDGLLARVVDTLVAVSFFTDREQAEMASDEFHARANARMGNRAQTNLVSLFIGLMIAAIIAIQVFMPVVNDAISSSNASGTTLTILDLLPLFAALLLLIALASPLMSRI